MRLAVSQMQRVVCFVVAILAHCTSMTRADEVPPGNTNCASFALFYLLKLERRGIPLGEISKAMPIDGREGTSMKEIAESARKWGVVLRPMAIDKPAAYPDNQVVAFLREGTGGHYIVTRSVGRRHTMVQVLDRTNDPVIIDIADLLRSPEWSGLAFVPERPNWPARITGAMTLISGIELAASTVLTHWRGRRRGDRSEQCGVTGD
jgi:hypothetical protein